jgi:hypothetical protein
MVSGVVFVLLAGPGAGTAAEPSATWQPGALKLVSKEVTEQLPLVYNAFYVAPTGLEMIGPNGRSLDNGRTWTAFTPTPDPRAGLPANYRRGAYSGWVDPVNGLLLQTLLSLDVETDPKVDEPPVGLTHYYLRYRVSADKGATYLFDEPMVQTGMTPEHPFPRVWTGKNGYCLGDAGCRPIRTRAGNILIPAIDFLLGADGKLDSPGGGFTYSDAMVIIGKWREDKRIEWFAVAFVEGDPARSTRGMDEPSLVEMPDGRILMVMRGSNGGSKDPEYKIPSYRWYAVSGDGGFTWTKPEPWTYDTGEAFFSPASMCELFTHSNGRVYWLGNISASQGQGNNPRYPFWIAEVEPRTLRLVKSTLTMLDTLQPDDAEGVNLSHHLAYEDRETHEIVIPMRRYNLAYTTSKPVVYRVSVK